MRSFLIVVPIQLLTWGQTQRWWERPSITNWIMVGLTAVYIGVNIFLLLAINRQSRIAREAALAAQASADAIKSIERPWLLIKDASRWSETQSAGPNPRQQRLAAVWRFKNFGKTPAFIIDIAGAIDIVEAPHTDLPSKPVYSKPYKIQDEIPVLAPDRESGSIEMVMSRPYSEDEWQGLINGKLFLVLYCRLEYESVFKDGFKHETCFCYQYVFAGMEESGFTRICGPPAYNRYT